MAHPSLPKIKAKLKAALKRLGIKRTDAIELAELIEEEAWAEEWQKDDWYHG